MNIFLLIILISLSASCGSKSKSPEFDPETIVQIKGQMLTPDGSALGNTQIELRNLRYYPYSEPNTPLPKFINWLFWRFAFFMFPAYEPQNDDMQKLPNYFLTNVTTDADGYYDFKVKAGNLLRDEQGGINIILLNHGEDMSQSYVKYLFVIGEQETNLGEIQQCNLGPFQVNEQANQVMIDWQAPTKPVDHYVIKIADASNNYLLWTATVDGDQESLELAKTIFMNKSTRIAIEAYYQNTEDFKALCLTPSQIFSLTSPTINLAANKLAASPQIDFGVTSVTNENYNDRSYFEAFDTDEITIDFNQDTSISGINLHNLLAESDATYLNAVIKCSVDSAPETFDTVLHANAAVSRFQSITLNEPTTCRHLKISFSGPISQLQEVTAW